MIVGIEGNLTEVGEDRVVVEVNDLVYELMVPACDLGYYTERRGQSVKLRTLHYLEGSPAGGNLIPRLVGFRRPQDKAFFERLITVKGLGMRKSLRVLTIPIPRIAGWIEEADAKALTTLPEIGKRLATQIIAELRGKLDKFFAGEPAKRMAAPPFQQQALEVLLQLGEKRSEAEDLIGRALRVEPELNSTERLIQAAYRLKTGHTGG